MGVHDKMNMKVFNRVLIIGIIFAVCWSFLPAITDAIKAIHNPLNRLGVLCVLFVGGVIVFFGCIDIVFGTSIAERIIATLVSNILWEILKFVWNILSRIYKLSLDGISCGMKILTKLFTR